MRHPHFVHFSAIASDSVLKHADARLLVTLSELSPREFPTPFWCAFGEGDARTVEPLWSAPGLDDWLGQMRATGTPFYPVALIGALKAKQRAQ